MATANINYETKIKPNRITNGKSITERINTILQYRDNNYFELRVEYMCWKIYFLLPTQRDALDSNVNHGQILANVIAHLFLLANCRFIRCLKRIVLNHFVTEDTQFLQQVFYLRRLQPRQHNLFFQLVYLEIPLRFSMGSPLIDRTTS